MKRFIPLFILIFHLAVCNGKQPIPALYGRVVDHADVLTYDEINQLEVLLKEIEDSTSTQIALLTVATTQPEEVEEYSIRVVEDWKLGQSEYDNGVLLLAAIEDRKFRIEVGYGLEGSLTDAFCKMVIVNQVVPHFKNKAYFKGFYGAINEIKNRIGEENYSPADKNVKTGGVSFLLIAIAFGLFLLFSAPIVVVALIIYFLMKRGSINTKSGRRSNSGFTFGSSSSSFGGSSGSSSFSGGGGSFGGGGASGSW